MPTFRYKAVTAEGKPANGVVEAEDMARAQDRLQNRGLRSVKVMPAVLPGKKRSYVTDTPRSPKMMLIVVLLVLLLGALGGLIYVDPYGWGLLDSLKS